MFVKKNKNHKKADEGNKNIILSDRKVLYERKTYVIELSVISITTTAHHITVQKDRTVIPGVLWEFNQKNISRITKAN